MARWRVRVRAAAVLAVAAVTLAVAAPAASGDGSAVSRLAVSVRSDAPPGGVDYRATVRYQVRVSNPGSVTVTGITVDDTLLGFIGYVESLAPGEVARMNASGPGGTGVVTASGMAGDGTPVSASAAHDVEVYAGDSFPDFAIDKYALSPAASPGGTVRYRLVVRNVSGASGPYDSLTITDSFSGAGAVVADAGGGVATGSRIVWRRDAPSSAEGPVVIEYALRVAAGARDGDVLRNTARVTVAGDTDPAPGNDAASASVRVEAPAREGGAADGDDAGAGAQALPAPATGTAGEAYLPFTGMSGLPAFAVSGLLAAIGALLRRLAARTVA